MKTRTTPKNVTAYIGGFPRPVQTILKRVRGIVRKAVPALAGYAMSKGTIRFPLSQPVPVKLIERIAKFRAKEVAASARRP